MINMKKLFILAAMLISITSTLSAQGLDEKYATDLLPVGTKAPDLIDVLHNTHSVDEFKGRCVVLDFFATWCGDCRKDLPEMRTLHNMYDLQGVEFVGISFDTDSDVLQEYMEKEHIKWRVLSELKKMKESQMAKDYHIQWIPTMYLLDTEGRILLATVEIDKLKAKLLCKEFGESHVEAHVLVLTALRDVNELHGSEVR